MKKSILLLTMFIFFLLTGCENNPVGSLLYNGVNDSSAEWMSPYVIYVNGDIKTSVLPFDDAIGTYTDYWKYQDPSGLEAKYVGVSHTGSMSLKVSWNGKPSNVHDSPTVENKVSCWFTTQNNKSASPSKDLTPGNYTKITFWAKTDFYNDVKAVVKVLGKQNGDSDYPLTTISQTQDWTYYEVDITAVPPTQITAYFVVDLAPISSPSASTNGGTIYIDDIRLVR